MKINEKDREVVGHEEMLWHALLQGDEEAFAEMIDRCYNLLFQYGLKFVRDRELVKDTIQDLFLEIWEKRDTLNAGIPPKAYLLASLRRRLHRARRRSLFTTEEDVYEDRHDFLVTFSAEYDFIAEEQDRFQIDRVSQMLNHLPSRQKEAVYLRFFQDLDRDAIADIMEIHPQSVSNLLQTAFKWLKQNWAYMLAFWLSVGLF